MPIFFSCLPVVIFLAALSATVSASSPDDTKISDTESVWLGADDLLRGIPGKGTVATEELRSWLADPANHGVLRPRLPIGLATGAADVRGLDTNPLTRAKIELGRQLFFDPRLSRDETISCASCHDPGHGYAAPTQFGLGIDGQEGNRNSPAAYNRILSNQQFWDGRAATLEEQAVGPIENPIEMGFTHDEVVARLKRIEGYRLQFERIFGEDVTIGNVGRALASFERMLVTGPSPWDHYRRLLDFEKAYAADLADAEELAEEDPELIEEHRALQQAAAVAPLSASARLGAVLFFNERGRCAQCHVGANLTDEQYHNLGVGMSKATPPVTSDTAIDWGRFSETGNQADRGAFKTPTVRNIALTAPYMHDGSQKTLEEVVQWYVDGGHPNPWLSDKILPLKLTAKEQAALVAFMRSLTGELPKVEQERLPE